MIAVPKIQITAISHTVGSGKPYDYMAVLHYGEGKCARIEFRVEAPQGYQGTGFELADSEFQRVTEALQQAVQTPKDESQP